METEEKDRLESMIIEYLKDIETYTGPKKDEQIDYWWTNCCYAARVLRTEIDKTGMEYIDQKESLARTTQGWSERVKNLIWLDMQRIILAREEKNELAFQQTYVDMKTSIKSLICP